MSPRSSLPGTSADDGAGVDYVCATCHHLVTYATTPDPIPWCYGKPISATTTKPTGEHGSEPTQFQPA
jgi:hypothetical protein